MAKRFLLSLSFLSAFLFILQMLHAVLGKDISGTLQGAGGVGGLLYLTIDGSTFVPLYDNNGNITHCLDSNDNVVAQYTYDAFSNTIAQGGLLADTLHHSDSPMQSCFTVRKHIDSRYHYF